MIYPQKLSSKKGEILLKLLLAVSVFLGILLFAINKLTTPEIHWAALVNCGIVYGWITVLYSIKKGTNIAGHVLIQTIIISVAVLYIDEKIGFIGWSLNLAIPIILIIANSTMLILTIVTHKNYIKYAIYQLLIVIISLVMAIIILNKIMNLKILSYIAIVLSVLNLAFSLFLCFRDVKDALIRKFHM